MSYTITPAMTKAGYLALQKMAHQHGFSWRFDLVREETVDAAMAEVFQAMMAASPPSLSARIVKAAKIRVKRFADKLEV